MLRSGWLTGAGHVSARPLGLPHLWVAQDGLLVTVAGDVTRRELLQVAGSLEPYGVWSTGQVFTAYTTATQAYDLTTLGDLYSRGVTIDSRRYSAEETEEALITNSEMTDYFVSGEVVSTFVGDGTALWEAWPGEYLTFSGCYSPEAVAEVVTTARRQGRARGVLLGHGAECEGRRGEPASGAAALAAGSRPTPPPRRGASRARTPRR